MKAPGKSNLGPKVTLPTRESLQSGWYCCKLLCESGKIKQLVVCIAVNMSDQNDGPHEAVAIDSMRWCHGVPQHERNAKCFGYIMNSYADQRSRRVEKLTPVTISTEPANAAQPANVAQPAMKKEILEKLTGPQNFTAAARRQRTKKPPFAVTDPVVA